MYSTCTSSNWVHTSRTKIPPLPELRLINRGARKSRMAYYCRCYMHIYRSGHGRHEEHRYTLRMRGKKTGTASPLKLPKCKRAYVEPMVQKKRALCTYLFSFSKKIIRKKPCDDIIFGLCQMARKILYHWVYMRSTCTLHIIHTWRIVSLVNSRGVSRSKGVSVSKGSALRIRIRNVVYF